MIDTTDIPLAWMGSLSVADQIIIDKLDERTRGAVERYIRSIGISGDDYESGWDDAIEAYGEELLGISPPFPRNRKRRRGK